MNFVIHSLNLSAKFNTISPLPGFPQCLGGGGILNVHTSTCPQYYDYNAYVYTNSYFSSTDVNSNTDLIVYIAVLSFNTRSEFALLAHYFIIILYLMYL